MLATGTKGDLKIAGEQQDDGLGFSVTSIYIIYNII